MANASRNRGARRKPAGVRHGDRLVGGEAERADRRADQGRELRGGAAQDVGSSVVAGVGGCDDHLRQVGDGAAVRAPLVHDDADQVEVLGHPDPLAHECVQRTRGSRPSAIREKALSPWTATQYADPSSPNTSLQPPTRCAVPPRSP